MIFKSVTLDKHRISTRTPLQALEQSINFVYSWQKWYSRTYV